MANSNKTVSVKSAQVTGFARWQIFKLAMAGLDYFTAFVGTEINDKLVVGLRSAADKVVDTSLGKAKTAILLVNGRKLFAWEVKANGDVYERTHKDENGSMAVRGSIGALKLAYGANNVRFVSLKELTAMAQKQKMDKDCALALGIETAKKAVAKIVSTAKAGKGKVTA